MTRPWRRVRGFGYCLIGELSDLDSARHVILGQYADRLLVGGNTQVLADHSHMVLDCALADVELPGDLLAGPMPCRQPKNFRLSLRQTFETWRLSVRHGYVLPAPHRILITN